ncbi:Bud site selection protein bud4, partial [Ceratobasidium sp. 423]
SQRPNVHEPPKRLGMLDAGRASTIMTEAGNRPTSYMSTSSNASSKREMTGRERIKAHKEMILQERGNKSTSETRPASDLEEQPALDVPVDSEELTLEESFNTQNERILSASRMICEDDKVARHRQAGDIENDEAWRTLRRPLDVNEYAKEIQEVRVQPGSTKAHGKVFVK